MLGSDLFLETKVFLKYILKWYIIDIIHKLDALINKWASSSLF